MTLQGTLLIGQQAVTGTQSEIYAINPATGEALKPHYRGGSRAEVEQACQLVEAAFDHYREASLETRARRGRNRPSPSAHDGAPTSAPRGPAPAPHSVRPCRRVWRQQLSRTDAPFGTSLILTPLITLPRRAQ